MKNKIIDPFKKALNLKKINELNKKDLKNLTQILKKIK
ncbi:uncharacterized protein METZ01_LOCUS296606 [marine metagenome]|uniref:Uncharacterized protein n=1 Tax=marine metagenome TaxID=408172 RepID=A0A382M8P2_9ZZZZ